MNKKINILFFVIALGWIGFLGHETYCRNQVWRSSVALWEDCIRNSPSDLAYLQLGNAYLERNGKFDVEKAILSYHEAIRRNPQNSLAWRNAGSALMIHKDIDLAKNFYKVALEINPNLPDAEEIKTLIGLLEKNKEVNIKWR